MCGTGVVPMISDKACMAIAYQRLCRGSSIQGNWRPPTRFWLRYPQLEIQFCCPYLEYLTSTRSSTTDGWGIQLLLQQLYTCRLHGLSGHLRLQQLILPSKHSPKPSTCTDLWRGSPSWSWFCSLFPTFAARCLTSSSVAITSSSPTTLSPDYTHLCTCEDATVASTRLRFLTNSL